MCVIIGFVRHVAADQIEAGLDHVRAAPRGEGTVDLIVRRPSIGKRETLTSAELSLSAGLVGDCWATRGHVPTGDGRPNPDCQVTLINSRFCALIAPSPDRRPLAGDQFHVDFDLSTAHLPAGTRLVLGDAIIEVTTEPHLGCGKFIRRFGLDAARVANSPEGRDLRLRGVNARVVVPGGVRLGDSVTKVQSRRDFITGDSRVQLSIVSGDTGGCRAD